MDGQVLTLWPHRRWRFDFPTELYPAVIERLRGLPARTEEAASSLTRAQATSAPEGAWSIQRHLGHLSDLESLLALRLDAYEAGEPALPAADMRNERTIDADHDARPLGDVLRELRAGRTRTVARLEAYPRDFFGRSAWHERLRVHKRVVDTCVFFADHDDHHLALITMLRQGASADAPR